jgi:hypothetical protein
MSDARFEDGDESPLRLLAQSAGDVPVLAALVQDAVLTVSDLGRDAGRRRFACLINRFRWEDRAAAEADRRPFERVRSLLTIEDVARVRLLGIDRGEPDTVLSLLSLAFTPDPTPEAGGGGELLMTFAGDGAIALTVETLDLRLEDVTRPYRAPSGRVPAHGA